MTVGGACDAGDATGCYDLAQLLETDRGGAPDVDAARRLYQRQPELPVIIMSGDLDVEELREAVEQGRARFLQKPVSLRNLARTLREVLQPMTPA